MRNLAVVLTIACCWGALFVFDPASVSAAKIDSIRLTPVGKQPVDARLGTPRQLRDAYHPWVPPTNTADWLKVSQSIRERLLVSNGLWPLPPKVRLKPVIHGKIDRSEYTIEKVYFASFPGHYVTGNLYRPKKVHGKIPGILCPHGHWSNGRFYDAGESKAKDQIGKGAEKFNAGARYPLQARMVELARMGCMVFHYDMVGYADSKQIGHRAGFTDAEAGLRLQNFMGLQTFNSIRALDFLLSLPEVDAKRIGVTGASGGGTQTFMLCALDPRPAVAFPAVMVSTGMQGGCVCENAEYLRVGINNIAIAALFAPKPMALSGADDWTIAIETKGLPELKQVYSLYGKADLVDAKCFSQFKHNYNQVSREMMFNWFNDHLHVGHKTPVVQQDFKPVPPAELSVFDDKHPLPKDAKSSVELRKYLTKVADEQFAALLPKNKRGLAAYRRVVGTAARVMLDPGVPAPKDLNSKNAEKRIDETLTFGKAVVGRKSAAEQVPVVYLKPGSFNGRIVLWLDGRGKSHLFGKDNQPHADVEKLLKAGMAVASADVFMTGEFLADADQKFTPTVNAGYQGYTFGYNRPLLSNRVRDILTTIAFLETTLKAKSIDLVGTGRAGVWALLARALAGDHVDRTIADVQGFSFSTVSKTTDPMYLPGASKYGGLGGLAALSAPGALTLAGMTGDAKSELKPLAQVYRAAAGNLDAGNLAVMEGGLNSKAVVSALLK